jgi:hypothetical protein
MSTSPKFTPLSLSEEQIQQVKTWFSWNDLLLTKPAPAPTPTIEAVSSTTDTSEEQVTRPVTEKTELKLEKDYSCKFDIEIAEISSSEIKLHLFKHRVIEFNDDALEDEEEEEDGDQPIGELVLNSQEALKDLLVESGGEEGEATKKEYLSFSMFWNFVLRSCFGTSKLTLQSSVHELLFMSPEERKLHRKNALEKLNRKCPCAIIAAAVPSKGTHEQCPNELIPHETCIYCRPIYKVLFVDPQSKCCFAFPFRAIDPLEVLYGQIADLSRALTNSRLEAKKENVALQRQLYAMKQLREQEDTTLMIAYEPNGPNPPQQRMFGRGGAVPTNWLRIIPRDFITAEEFNGTSLDTHVDKFEVLRDGIYRFFNFSYRGYLGQVVLYHHGTSNCALGGPPQVQLKGGEAITQVVRRSAVEPFEAVVRCKKGDIITIGPCVKRGMQDGDQIETPNSSQSFNQTWVSTKMKSDANAKRSRNPNFESFEAHGVVGFFIEKWSESR